MTDPKQQPTPRGDVLRGLIEKLEGAAGGSRELDAEIRHLLVGRHIIVWSEKVDYTTSIDAVLALIERRGFDARDMLQEVLEEMGVRGWSAKSPMGPQIALACCIALLQALTPQVEGRE